MTTPTPGNGTVKPGSTGVITSAASAEAKKRKSLIDAARRKQNDSLNKQNATALTAARKKKGIQNYTKKSIEGNPDFGVGNAGPGTPYKIKGTQTSELPAPAPSKRPGATQKPASGNVTGLWSATGNPSKTANPDWKLMAIRRRLNNG